MTLTFTVRSMCDSTLLVTITSTSSRHTSQQMKQWPNIMFFILFHVNVIMSDCMRNHDLYSSMIHFLSVFKWNFIVNVLLHCTLLSSEYSELYLSICQYKHDMKKLYNVQWNGIYNIFFQCTTLYVMLCSFACVSTNRLLQLYCTIIWNSLK